MSTEAMAAGLPIIAGLGCGGTPWTLDYGQVGDLADVTDPVKLAQAIVALASDPARANQLAARGWQHARMHFTIDAVVRGYEIEYQRALGRPAP